MDKDAILYLDIPGDQKALIIWGDVHHIIGTAEGANIHFRSERGVLKVKNMASNIWDLVRANGQVWSSP